MHTGRYATCYKAAEATGLSRGAIEHHLRALRKMGVPVEALRQERAKELPQEPVGAPNTPPPPPGPPTPGEEEAKRVAAIKWATSARGEENPAVVICDGHGSHMTLKLILECRRRNIYIAFRPPHTSHKMQPEDVTAFSYLKQKWLPPKWAAAVVQAHDDKKKAAEEKKVTNKRKREEAARELVVTWTTAGTAALAAVEGGAKVETLKKVDLQGLLFIANKEVTKATSKKACVAALADVPLNNMRASSLPLLLPPPRDPIPRAPARRMAPPGRTAGRKRRERAGVMGRGNQ